MVGQNCIKTKIQESIWGFQTLPEALALLNLGSKAIRKIVLGWPQKGLNPCGIVHLPRGLEPQINPPWGKILIGV